ncbi:MAG: hypothetical protein ICV64_00695 [Thermoleophilia bacterium]|nr:hypothetical protein [Thermoleophilia bacterium]
MGRSAQIGAAVVAAAALAGLAGCGAAADRPPAGADSASAAPCPLDRAGGFPERRAWVRAVAEQAGYAIVDRLGDTLVVAGRGRTFSAWAVEDSDHDPHLPRIEEWDVVARVGAVDVHGDARSTRWWPAQGYLVWIAGGVRPGRYRLPGAEELSALVAASLSLPAPPPC